MIVHFSKWGNSVAVRIPAAMANELSAGPGTTAEMRLEHGRLVIEPVRPQPQYTLDELLDGMTPEDAYPEVATGPAVGREID
ncbi:AbrB/MazE/SpoVT family DNA-binding domain-containing protein [Salinarimonas sp. NSM]|uniref:AbrB/MazE/SpoVT family DNA-binding domain-containing protein n=1 Tax=Salinarimonas sp. NSM TaxID=3458003 RepID=UPI004035D67E